MAVDWTDETLRSLDELARIAFPEGTVTADTLKRRARQGKLAVYRPGKFYLSTLVDIKAFLEASRVEPKSKPPPPVSDWRRRIAAPPDPFGRSEAEVALARLEYHLNELRRPQEEAARLRKEERARNAPAAKLERQKRRNNKAREVYQEKNKARLKAEQE
jgi:hypothetical protein